MVYDMQFKDMEVQCIVWRKLNVVVERKERVCIFQGVHGGWCESKLEYCLHCLWD